jgi:hypothetical protein
MLRGVIPGPPSPPGAPLCDAGPGWKDELLVLHGGDADGIFQRFEAGRPARGAGGG